MSIFAEVERRFAELRPELETALDDWKVRQDSLRAFHHPEELIRFCRDQDDLNLEKDRVILALCNESEQELPSLLLIWLFLPCLISLKKDMASDSLEPLELESELVAGLWETVATASNDCRNLCGRLKNGAHRRAQQAKRRACAHLSRRENLDEHQAVAPASENPLLLLESARSAGIVSTTDAKVILLTRYHGLSMEEAAQQLDLTYSGIRWRRWNAEERIASWLRGRSGIPAESPK
jgi:ECF sigma factor